MLDGKVVIDAVDDGLNNCRSDTVRASASKDEFDLSVFFDEGGCHHGGKPSAGFFPVKSVRIQIFFAEEVIESNSGVGNHGSGSRSG